MLVNQKASEVMQHVEFVEYTGKYPNLCGGVLTLKIDGEVQKFGNDQTYPRFWRSGGFCSADSYGRGEWYIDVSLLPEQFHKYGDEIDNVFNVNVEHGCCGGCRFHDGDSSGT